MAPSNADSLNVETVDEEEESAWGEYGSGPGIRYGHFGSQTSNVLPFSEPSTWPGMLTLYLSGTSKGKNLRANEIVALGETRGELKGEEAVVGDEVVDAPLASILIVALVP
ncbi:hypothetical protein BN1723_003343 [Verticillium longisporum]|uniref:Uncharacterized protein n=1 Tax=Verticillium longisporum TaxID=100787 RepID=A0A0G4LV95_VERLO|nr:hypothetical protein BN1723_003343 [Verticillium longisporum]